MDVKASILRKAVIDFHAKDYGSALEHYKEFERAYPELAHTVLVNKAIAKSRLNGGSSIDLSEVSLSIGAAGEPVNITDDSAEITDDVFDSPYYLSENPDVKAAGVHPVGHYYSDGEREGRKPNRWFDPVFYSKLNADVREAKMSPFRHYVDSGKKEGRLGQSPLRESDRVGSQAKKPLLFVGHDGVLAGSEIVLLEVIRWFYNHTNRRIKLLLLAPGPVADRYAEFCDLYVLPKEKVDSPKDLKSFLSENFEFAYLNTVVSGRLFPILDKHQIPLKGDVVTHIHEMEKVLALFPEEMSRLLANTKTWISASPASSKTLMELYGIESSSLTTVPAFINPVARKNAEHNELKAEARHELGLSQDSFVVTGCGTIYWRKGTDIFVQVAKELKKRTQKPIEFVWLGQGPDKIELQKNLTKEEKKWIRFAGNRADANKLLAAADVFFMSSREDPFPLVVLESAQHGVPAVCFEPATGITAFVEQDAGVIVSDIDVGLAADAFQFLLENPEQRERLGRRAKHKLFEQYTTDKQNVKIFSVIVDETCYKPSISVLVPFYNHEKYVDERIASILAQPIKDIEVILLDDCSSDGTVDRLEPYLADSRVTLIKNEVNSGSPFKQWEKGIDLARSDLVWIAEGDDSCSKNFLSELLVPFEDPLVNIAFAKVEMIDERSVVKPNAFKPYFDMAAPGKFEKPYVKTGIQEVEEQFGAYQTLVNASGLVIRKSSFGGTLKAARTHKMCGDWLIYLECMKRGKIAYCPSAINYFRRHSASQVAKVEGSEQYFRERFEITQYIVENFPVGKKLLTKAFRATDHEWHRFKHKHPGKSLSQLYDKSKLLNLNAKEQNEKLPSLIVVVSDLSPGGGQLFSIRLANAWHKAGGEVVLVNVGKHPEHPQVKSKVSPEVPFYNAHDIKLSEIASIYSTDIVHSSVWWSDKYVHENYCDLPEKVRWIISTHGCYEALISSPSLDGSFREYFEGMLYEVDCWVYTAEKNLKVFKELGRPDRLTKILNGYEPEAPTPIDKTALGVRSDSMVVCLASRATEDKGWFVAVDAVKALNDLGLKTDLILVGEGPAADAVRALDLPGYIHLTGQVSNLQDYIAISDVGILPSMFVSESMPLVLIEFMAQGKAMVATDIGEIRNMTQDRDGSAAIVIDLNNGKVSSKQLSAELAEIHRDPSLRKSLAEHSSRRFQFFEMKNMLNEYQKVYNEVLV